MILKGLDEDWSKVDPTQAANDGFGFAFGYVSQDNTGKNLSPADVSRIHGAGMAVALVYEYNPQSALGGYSAGARDAGIAIAHAQSLGAPRGVALYAAVDWDVTDAQKPAVLAYATGFLDACTAVGFRSGIYGGYWVCLYLSDHNYGGFLWQTYAWSGGLWLAAAAVRQTRNGIHEAGATVDLDESEVIDFGQWSPASAPAPVPVPTPIGDSMLTHWSPIQRGATGARVRVWQGLMIGHGYGLTVDGDFGPQTDAVTRQFQTDKRITVDGIVGAHSLSMALYDADYA